MSMGDRTDVPRKTSWVAQERKRRERNAPFLMLHLLFVLVYGEVRGGKIPQELNYKKENLCQGA